MITRPPLFFDAIDQLPGGRRAEATSASQRARMLRAVTRAVADKGYAQTTVADIVGMAGVSRSTFYEQFADKQDCFLAAYEAGTEALIRAMAEAVGDLPADVPWRAILDAAVGAYLGMLADHPDFARTFIVDVLGAGPVAVARRRAVYDRFADQYRLLVALRARQEPGTAAPADVFLLGLVGGVAELVQVHIADRGAATLRELRPVLVQLATAVIDGTAASVAGAAAGARKRGTRGAQRRQARKR